MRPRWALALVLWTVMCLLAGIGIASVMDQWGAGGGDDDEADDGGVQQVLQVVGL